ncbi:MAG: hypothetical protein AB7F31_01450 [Parachlamydiales bacterium]
MPPPRSERLKKFEAELADLEQWLKLGLVPKKDITKHEAEIAGIKVKIEEEEQRLKFLKESGEGEEYVTPRKQPTRTQYTETPTMPEMDLGDESSTIADMMEESEEVTGETVATEEKSETEETALDMTREEEDPFSDRNRWRRGMLHGEDEEW